MCDCKNIYFGDERNHAQRIRVKIPSHMKSYKQARLKDGLSDLICIDPCIFNEIQSLWALGIITYGSCCGHNIVESMVNVHDNDVQLMLELGYIQNHIDKTRKDTFKLKTA